MKFACPIHPERPWIPAFCTNMLTKKFLYKNPKGLWAITPMKILTWAGLMDPSDPLGSWLSPQISPSYMVSPIFSSYPLLPPFNPSRRWKVSVFKVPHCFFRQDFGQRFESSSLLLAMAGRALDTLVDLYFFELRLGYCYPVDCGDSPSTGASLNWFALPLKKYGCI